MMARGPEPRARAPKSTFPCRRRTSLPRPGSVRQCRQPRLCCGPRADGGQPRALTLQPPSPRAALRTTTNELAFSPRFRAPLPGGLEDTQATHLATPLDSGLRSRSTPSVSWMHPWQRPPVNSHGPSTEPIQVRWSDELHSCAARQVPLFVPYLLLTQRKEPNLSGPAVFPTWVHSIGASDPVGCLGGVTARSSSSAGSLPARLRQ